MGRQGPPPRAETKPAAELTEQDKQIVELRQQISRAIGSHDLDAATKTYLQLIDEHGEQTLSQRQQFDIANHLFAQGSHASAAVAYERTAHRLPQARRARPRPAHARPDQTPATSNKPNDAKPLLQEASQRLHGDDAALARQLLSEIG